MSAGITYQQLCEKIATVVGEHALGYVVIAEVPNSESDELDTATIAIWRGGINRAMGLCDRGKIRMKELCRRNDFPADPPDPTQSS